MSSEVTLEHSNVKALKPKFWLTCHLELAAATAVKIG